MIDLEALKGRDINSARVFKEVYDGIQFCIENNLKSVFVRECDYFLEVCSLETILDTALLILDYPEDLTELDLTKSLKEILKDKEMFLKVVLFVFESDIKEKISEFI